MLARVLNSLAVRSFQAGTFLLALLQYWLSPYGLRGGGGRRLRSLCEEGLTAVPQPARICVFVLYSRSLTCSRRCAIEFWNQAGFHVVVVNNLPLDAGDMAALTPLAWCVFERVNMGQDIGAYQDAVLWLAQTGKLERCQALALTNDSLQFIPGHNAVDLAQRIESFLDAPRPEALFSHVSYQYCRHYQSFFQVLKPSVFRSRKFLSFWRSYRPINNRLHCIHKGELELSRQVYNQLRHVRVLYTTEALSERLRNALHHQQPISADSLLLLMPSIHRTQLLKVDNPALNTLLEARGEARSLCESEIYCIADLIENNNPSHVAAFLYPFYLGCPYVKRDLCFAGSYSLAQAINLYEDALRKSLGSTDAVAPLLSALSTEYAEALQQKGIPLAYKNNRFAAMKKGLKGGFFYSATTIV